MWSKQCSAETTHRSWISVPAQYRFPFSVMPTIQGELFLFAATPPMIRSASPTIRSGCFPSENRVHFRPFFYILSFSEPFKRLVPITNRSRGQALFARRSGIVVTEWLAEIKKISNFMIFNPGVNWKTQTA